MQSKKGQITALHLAKPFVGLGILIAIGSAFYYLVEGWTILDSLFMSVETLTTVGFGLLQPLSRTGKIFTIVYIIFGVVLFLYLAAQFAEYVIYMNFEKVLSKRTMENKLKNMKNHYIVCGYGRTGQEIAKQLQNEKAKFVVIDKQAELETTLNEINSHYIIADATDDEILEKANIKTAKGLFCCLSDDADNLYLTMSAKDLNNNISIVARCVKASNESKFKRAGVKNVILPYEISGRRMVSSIVKPLVVDFLDVVMHTQGKDGLELAMEQFEIKNGSILENETFVSSQLRKKTGVIVIAIKRNGEFITNPAFDTVLLANDELILMGTTSQLVDFDKAFNK